MGEVILIVLGALAVVIAIVVPIIQRKRKSLIYDAPSMTPLLNLDKSSQKTGIAVLYNGEMVQDVYLFMIKFTNSGNVPIASREFETPLKLDFGTGTTVLSAELYDSEPNTLKFNVNICDDYVELEPTLINPKDTFTIKTFIANYDPKVEFKVKGRVYGIKEIALKPAISTNWEGFSIGTGILTAIIYFIGFKFGKGPLFALNETNGMFVRAFEGIIWVVIIIPVIYYLYNKLNNRLK
jgi:hypothetical protein